MFSDMWKLIFMIVFIMVGMFMIAWAIDSSACQEKWAHSGFKSEYGLIKGCMVILPDGRIIPADSYREFQ